MTDATSSRAWDTRLRDALCWPSKVLWGVSAVVVLGMATHVLLDVIMRTFSPRPLPGTLELTSHWWMPIIIFSALGAAQLKNEHIRVTLLVDGLRGHSRRFAEVLALVIALIVIGLTTMYAIEGAIRSTLIGEALLTAIAVPIWPIKWIAVLGLTVFSLQLILSLWDVVTTSEESLEELDEADILIDQLRQENQS